MDNYRDITNLMVDGKVCKISKQEVKIIDQPTMIIVDLNSIGKTKDKKKRAGYNQLIDSLYTELSKDGMVNDGIIATKLGLQGIPDMAEKIIIDRDLNLLEDFNCRYHISQISSSKSLEAIKQKKNKVKFTTGVSINNLSLNENDIGDFRTFLKLSPPLRTEEDRESLVQALNNRI